MKYLNLILLMLLMLGLVNITPTAAQDATTCESGFRVVEHELLEAPICVPENPERIVAQQVTAFELMLMLDMPPVARPSDDYLATLYGGTPAVFDRVMEFVGAQPVYGASFDINTEVLLEAQPDLVIVYPGLVQNIDQLREFTTVIESPIAGDQPNEWSVLTEFFAEVIGVSDEYDVLMSQYNERLDTLQEVKDPVYEGMSLVYVQDAAGTNYVGLPGLPLWETVMDAGFVPVETLPTTPEESLEQFGSLILQVSDEQLPLLNADVIVIVNGNVNRDDRETATAVIESYRSNPLWATLDAVQNDRLFAKAVYWQSNGLVSVHAVLDDMFVDFGGVDPAEVSPNPFLASETEEVAAAECEAGFRLVVEVCVPENPQRVVALSDTDLDAVLALGVQPVGITNGRGQSTPPRYLADYITEDMTVLGDFFTPNLEVLLEVDPDLILVGGLADEAVLEQLNAIAPVVDTYANGYEWQTQFLTAADALNMQAEAEAFIAAYDAHIIELQTTLEAHLGEEFIVARWGPEGPQVMAPITFVSAVLFDLGLTSPAEIPELQSGHAHSAPLSLETLGIIDVDWAFLGTLQGEGDAVEALTAVVENPLFQALDVVQNERVIFIDGSLWTSSGGPLAVMLVLDDVEAAMTGAAD